MQFLRNIELQISKANQETISIFCLGVGAGMAFTLSVMLTVVMLVQNNI